MITKYNSLDLSFEIQHCTFRPLNIVFEQFQRAIPRHSHSEDCYEIHYIPYGKGTLILDGHRWQLGKDSLYVTGPHVEHEQFPDPDNPMAEYCIFFHVSRDKKAPPSAGHTAQTFLSTPMWIGEDTQGMHPVMQQLFAELEAKNTGYAVSVRACLQLIVVYLVRNYRATMSPMQAYAPAVQLADQKAIIMDESFLYDYRTLTLDTLAARLALSPRQTERLLRAQYGQTFQQKRTTARMSAAEVLLKSSDQTITAIAEQLGFSSIEHFSNAFRAYSGMSPRQYREQFKGAAQVRATQ